MLSSAAFRGHTEVAELLLDHGADLEATNEVRLSPCSRQRRRAGVSSWGLQCGFRRDGSREAEERGLATFKRPCGARPCRPPCLEVLALCGWCTGCFESARAEGLDVAYSSVLRGQAGSSQAASGPRCRQGSAQRCESGTWSC